MTIVGPPVADPRRGQRRSADQLDVFRNSSIANGTPASPRDGETIRQEV